MEHTIDLIRTEKSVIFDIAIGVRTIERIRGALERDLDLS
jgi:hypothetical protein